MRGWYGGVSRPWLAPLALVFAAATGLRRLAYRCGLLVSGHPGVPVIVVGNLAVGGTGKTPLVIWLAQQLRARGVAVGVVLRGYGGKATAPQLVTAASAPDTVCDEAVLILRRTGCPVAVGRRRIAAARLLVAAGCRVIISDDGLQHLALQRDLEIIVIDGMRGLGNGALLPQGPLREKPRRLRNAAAVVINGRDATGIGARIAAPLSMVMEAGELCALQDDQAQPLAALRDAQVHAVAATGNPARFFALLREPGCRPVEHAFPDHYAFKAEDLSFADALPIVMTEKDAVKCSAFATGRMQYLKVSARLPEADASRLLQLALDCIANGER